MSFTNDAKEVVEKVISSLPPSFLALLSINTLFLLALIWFMHDLAVARMEAVVKLFDSCTKALIH